MCTLGPARGKRAEAGKGFSKHSARPFHARSQGLITGCAGGVAPVPLRGSATYAPSPACGISHCSSPLLDQGKHEQTKTTASPTAAVSLRGELYHVSHELCQTDFFNKIKNKKKKGKEEKTLLLLQ